jgi:hypothetical protein
MTPPPTKSCGSCSLCCKVLRVDELQKPMGVWCSHFRSGTGCGIHGSHPPSCNNYQCLWILSPTMPDSVRPDRCKVVMSIDDGDRRIIARADPGHPDAWRQQPVYGQLKAWATAYWFKGRSIYAMVGKRMWLITPKEDVDLGEPDERSPIAYEVGPDGHLKVTILPPLGEGEDYDQVQLKGMLGWTPNRPVQPF